MRNFYMIADVDGRKSPLSGGPARKDGEMRIDIHQKEDGESVVAFKVSCRVEQDELVTTVYDSKGCFLADYRSQR